jgi:hypothetical protein
MPLSAPNLLKSIRLAFNNINDHRSCRQKITLTDALMSGLAVFSLKCPSLLQFDEKQKETTIRHNLGTLYGISEVPCDTQMRSILDPVNPVDIEPAFIALHQAAAKVGLFKQYEYFDGRVLISIDGTGHFSSNAIECPHCCAKKHRNGNVEYYHQLLGAVVVHPDYPAVIPLAPEPITKGDGQTKNDCERNAAKRLLKRIKGKYKHLKPIIAEDGLSSNGPHIKLLISMEFSYILGAKPGDHEALFALVNDKMRRGEVEEFEVIDKANVIHGYRFANQIPLNDSHPDLLVNFLEYWEVDGAKVQNFSWVTDIKLTANTVEEVMRGGRARWNIENETFNTLKNQGYHLEHNYGHGQQYLSSVFGCLTFPAFLIDQLQAWGCCLFRQARQARRTLKSLWDQMRSLFTTYLIASWEVLWLAITYGHLAANLEVNNTS